MWSQEQSKWVDMGVVDPDSITCSKNPPFKKTFGQCVSEAQEAWHKILLELMYAWKLDKVLNWINKLLEKGVSK